MSQLFFFYNDLDGLKQNDWQFKTDFKHQIVHPFKDYKKDTEIKDMAQINVTLEMCTLYKGVPHGIASINYTYPESDHLSFRGVGVFHHGKLHNAPFTCLPGDGWPFSFSKMQNGRPADGSYFTQFTKDGAITHVDSLEEKTQVGGW